MTALILKPANLRGKIYHTLRSLTRFRQWEKHYQEILKNGPALSKNFLPDLLTHAVHRVPYYRKIAHENEWTSLNLEQFPLMNKPILRENFDALKEKEKRRPGEFMNSSGGSTGNPQVFVQNREFVEWSLASLTYYFHVFLGVEYASVPKVIYWGSERDLFHQRKSFSARALNWMTQSFYVNSFKMTPEIMRASTDTINRVRPVFVKGYATSLYEIAKFIQEHHLQVWKPKFIYSSAETLQPFMRTVIESAFNAPVYDFYGSREVGSIAGQCREQKMHIFSFNTHVEVLDDQNRAVEPGQSGRLVVTTLHNYSMPLIRYEIGDTAVRGKDCSCGSPLPVLERIQGRVTDNFLTADNTVVHGEYFTHLFYFRPWLTEFQVVQEDVDRIHVYYVSKNMARPPQTDVTEIDQKIRLVMGEHCGIQWEAVSEVPRTPQGKLLFTRSLIYGKPS